jgi:hypothetical protein
MFAGGQRCSLAYLNYINFHFVNKTSPRFRSETVGYIDH